jgi:hypothetical protein
MACVSGMMAAVSVPLSEGVLTEIERRVAAAREVAKEPWNACLETHGGLGGESFIQFNADGPDDDELYLSVHLNGREVRGPDRRVDAVIEFIGYSMRDVQLLLSEVRRLRGDPGGSLAR